MNDGYITLSELTDEIYCEKYSNNEKSDESFQKLIRNKFNFLMNRIVMRSKLDWRYKNKDVIPLTDKDIVKALLEKSISNKPEDELFCKWFNDSISETDLESIIDLGKKVEFLIDDEINYDDWEKDIDGITKQEWIAAIGDSIGLNKAIYTEKYIKYMNRLYEATNVLNHSIPLGQIIEQSECGKRSCIFRRPPQIIDTSLPLNEAFKSCSSQEEYVKILLQILEIITNDAHSKTIKFIKTYAKLKKLCGVTCADEALSNISLASEYVTLFQNIYEYLYDRPNITKDIEAEIGTEDLLNFFKMKDRNAKNPKKTKKDE